MKREEDNLEKFIRENRSEFDRFVPPSAVKRRLFSAHAGARRLVMRPALLRAASVIIITGLSLLLAYNAGIRRSFVSANSNPELRETELYYESLMNSVFSKANPLFTQFPELEYELKADIVELEDIGEELKEDLGDNISNREVVEALIRNYRLRIRMLEELVEDMPRTFDENIKDSTDEI
jgi:hypothetical protein